MRIKDIPNATTDEILRNLLDVLSSLRDGHLTAFMTEGFPGIAGEIAKVLNQHLGTMSRLKQEHHRIMEEVGVTGRLGGQMEVPGLSGAWQEILQDTNRMAANITGQFRDGGNVVGDLLRGDPKARMTARIIHGEFSEFREKLNALADEYQDRAKASAAAPT